MSTFFSESYSKPKLMESKIINKIVNQQNTENIILKNIKDTLYDIMIAHYKVILFIIFIVGCLYWRYIEIQDRREKLKMQYEDDY
jgi:hypothetical protein